MEKENENDDVLYNRFRHGDTAAFDALMMRHDNPLMWYLYGILHDYQEAEDMMIETFARIMVKKPHIGEGCFKAYLYKAGRNLALRVIEKKNKLDVFSLDEMTTEPVAEGTVEEQTEAAEMKELLRQCLDRIDPAQSEALYLIYYEGLSYKEAAGVMKIGVKKFDKLLQTGKKKMREELKKEGIERGDPHG